MALIPFVGFVGGSYLLRSVNYDCQRCVNLFPELDEIGTGKNQEIAALMNTPGLSYQVPAIGSQVGPDRGRYVASTGDAYQVSNDTAYKITDVATFTFSAIGTMTPIATHVSMADNGTQLMIVDGVAGYIYTFATGIFAAIADVDFPNGATSVVYLDGYFIVNKAGTNKFYISGLNDGTSWDALDFSSKEGKQDRLISVQTVYRELVLMGDLSIEVWQNTGAADFPFERAYFLEEGLAAARTAKPIKGRLFWVGRNANGRGCVYRSQGYQPVRISTTALEQAIDGYGDISTATAWSYEKDGHSFYLLNFNEVNTTWVFDESTNLWHERISGFEVSSGQGQLTHTVTRWRAENHVFVGGKHLVGDYVTGSTYELSDTKYFEDQDGSHARFIPRIRRFPHFSTNGKRATHNYLQIDMETGVGLDQVGESIGVGFGIAPIGTDPQAMLRWSDDGGHSWSNEHWVKIGKLGEYRARAKWNRLGMTRDRVYEVTITEPVKVVMISAFLDITECSN